MQLYAKVCILSAVVLLSVHSLPHKRQIASTSNELDEMEASNSSNSTNGTNKDLYVIRAVVYEIGILSNSPANETEEEMEADAEGKDEITHEEIDLTFFDAKSNRTHLNLGDIPLPIQIANVSGQVITGIAPVHIGAVDNIGDLLNELPLTGPIMNITNSNSGYISLSSKNITLSSLETKIETAEDLDRIPSLLSDSVPLTQGLTMDSE